VVPIRHDTNRGVGGAIKTGYRHALRDGVDVVAVMGGDGQMPPELLADVIRPVVDGHAGYAKGNRLVTPGCRREMPDFRYVGNHLLSYLTKVASGYWGVSDPQNGFTAISQEALDATDFEEMYEDYGYCNDLLTRLNVAGVRVAEVPQPPTYGDEESNIRYSSYIPKVSTMLFHRFCWRVWTRYTTSLHPVALCYWAAGSLFAVGSTSLVRDIRSEGSGVRSASTALVLIASVLSCLLAMLIDRDVNYAQSYLSESSAGPSDEDAADGDGIDLPRHSGRAGTSTNGDSGSGSSDGSDTQTQANR
jgi:glycosyltransferase involved in cell wall biosynthesis